MRRHFCISLGTVCTLPYCDSFVSFSFICVSSYAAFLCPSFSTVRSLDFTTIYISTSDAFFSQLSNLSVSSLPFSNSVALYSTSLAFFSVMPTDNCGSVRDPSDDLFFRHNIVSLQPFRQGHVVYGDNDREAPASSPIGLPPSGSSVLAPSAITHYIDNFGPFIDAKQLNAIHQAD